MSSVLAGYARTPFVRSLGAFATVPATVLGAHAVTAALQRAGIDPGQVHAVVGGQVLQAGAGQNPARQSAVAAGIPLTAPATTLNAVCLSGLEAVAQAHRLITAGEADVVVAVGQESMSLAPHAWVGSRTGARFGAVSVIDTLEHDGLSDAFDGTAMGLATDAACTALGIDRAAQDAWAATSHQRAALAARSGVLGEEITAVEVPGRRGSTTVAADDGIRPDTAPEVLARLRPAFTPEGTITAGSSSQITDGAAALVLTSEAYARAHRVTGLAEVLAHAVVAGPGTTLHAQPANAAARALQRIGAAPGDAVAVEINEAFAAVAVHSTRLLGVDPALVNAHGGAIALGHPIGASGARIAGHLALRLHRAGSGAPGVAAICGGGGQGAALVLRAR
ncbi:acetyl-CoA C-acyltransferase [Paenibacillus sp. TRM 82003]|uniref:acetyl-CoA C-acyltransferase n=1 Tax=Kineococcus sp. TRM81007 TaxID=2925831 RepID=UPI001F5A717B|nr:acetyl-CoA C-acyltransferase [Kineococcus sp. TRM81007]MCI2240428.1 acetyl-CoA C-acyltransferase [Kineococcus sp. TRM81007]MCI3927396.1 acetyl-CoA C-acyltransferase [Paenibacillus sp. TRM 82003]